MHNSISLTNISKYFRFTKELALYQNDNYVGSNENALIYIQWMQHTRLSRSARKSDAARIKGSNKGVASDKRCNIYSPTLDTSIQCVLYKNTVHYIDYIGAELVRGRVC